uniref:WWE domain-containing protein n=1 Tax=Heterorhabditis bacteriophora TaxID=37862 RepID=A0A1I7WEG3_HETBA
MSSPETKNFLWKIVTGDEQWIMYDNPKHTHSLVDPEHSRQKSPSVHLMEHEGCTVTAGHTSKPIIVLSICDVAK